MLESQIPKTTPVVPNASLRLRTYFHSVSKLRARIRNSLFVRRGQSIDRSHLVDSYLRAAARLEDKVGGWCDIHSWLPRKVMDPANHQPHGTPWTSGTLFRLHYFECWAGFFHWNRYFVARICLHTALLDALTHHVGHFAAEPAEKTSTIMKDLVSLHTAAIHETVRDFLGTLAYAFGDVDDQGRDRPIPTPVVSDGAAKVHRGINIPAVLQVQPPLSFLVTSKYIQPAQLEAVFLALQRVRAEFCLR